MRRGQAAEGTSIDLDATQTEAVAAFLRGVGQDPGGVAGAGARGRWSRLVVAQEVPDRLGV
ncbi:MAG: hypothetical protein ACREQL_14530 [Candidatus Binatia bacterium]